MLVYGRHRPPLTGRAQSDLHNGLNPGVDVTALHYVAQPGVDAIVDAPYVIDGSVFMTFIFVSNANPNANWIAGFAVVTCLSFRSAKLHRGNNVEIRLLDGGYFLSVAKDCKLSAASRNGY